MGKVAKKPPQRETSPIDRRNPKERRAASNERRKEPAPAAAAVAVERRQLERRTKVVRRRQIDPTTCERDYSDAEVEFMNAIDDYKRKSGRMFPTCSEILEVLLALGYEKRSPHAGPATPPSTPAETLAAFASPPVAADETP